MKKNIIIYFLTDTVLTVAAALLCIGGHMAAGLCCLAILALLWLPEACAVVWFRYKSAKRFNPIRKPERNFPALLLGNDKTDGRKDALDMRESDRNIYTDILVMERYYSLVKKGGTIVFCIDRRDKRYLGKGVSLLGRYLLHPVTLMEHGLRPAEPLELAGMAFFAERLRHRSGKPCFDRVPAEYTDRIRRFCEERGLRYDVRYN